MLAVHPWQEGFYITWYETGTLKYLNIRTKTKRLSTERLCSNKYLKKLTKVINPSQYKVQESKIMQRRERWCVEANIIKPFKLLSMNSKRHIEYAISSNSVWSISLSYAILRPYIEEKQKQNIKGWGLAYQTRYECIWNTPNDKIKKFKLCKIVTWTLQNISCSSTIKLDLSFYNW